MKLATLKDGTRDGQLAVVSRDLKRAVVVGGAVPTMQSALDDWRHVAPLLAELSAALAAGDAGGAPVRNAISFDIGLVQSPLPRAYQWIDGSAYVNHVELVRRARGAAMPPEFWTDPLMYQGGSDTFLAPLEDIAFPDELGKGFGFLQSKPSSSFAPVAVTPDELGDAWRDGRLHLPLLTHLNGALFGRPNAGVDMTFNFPQLIAHAAKTRALEAGTIVGSGTVSNKENDGPGRPVVAGGAGYACIAEQRTVETILAGKPATPFLRFGDRVRIEMFDAAGASIFGAIDQAVRRTP
jgi:fumarylacetoacetate (FAA) hydrolase